MIQISADFVIYEPLTLWRCQTQLSNRYMYPYIFPPNCAIALSQNIANPFSTGARRKTFQWIDNKLLKFIPYINNDLGMSC